MNLHILLVLAVANTAAAFGQAIPSDEAATQPRVFYRAVPLPASTDPNPIP